jgi:hypothetical protein
MDVTVPMYEYGSHLSTRPKGIRDFGKVCERLAKVRPGEVVLLDFDKVGYVSASWITAMMVPLSRRAAEEVNDFFLLLRNFPADSLDDLKLVADQNRVPFLLLAGKTKARLIGTLDSGQQETLRSVEELGEVTGAELAVKKPALKTSGPAWNNRLRDLHEKRLLRRRKQGREQIYRAVVPEVTIDG